MQEYVTDLRGCARCRGEGHPALTFTQLVYPIEVEEGDFTYWAPCPTNGEPILMRVESIEKEKE